MVSLADKLNTSTTEATISWKRGAKRKDGLRNSRDYVHPKEDRKAHPFDHWSSVSYVFCANGTTKESSPLTQAAVAILFAVFRTISWSSSMTGLALVCETQRHEKAHGEIEWVALLLVQRVKDHLNYARSTPIMTLPRPQSCC